MENVFVYKYDLANDIGDGSGRYGLIAHFPNDQVGILSLNLNVRESLLVDSLQKVGRVVEKKIDKEEDFHA